MHHHAFLFKKKDWSADKYNNQRPLIDGTLKQETVIISRDDLYASSFNLQNFFIRTLMWGYPSLGREKNIEKMLEKSTFKTLIERLESYRDVRCLQ